MSVIKISLLALIASLCMWTSAGAVPIGMNLTGPYQNGDPLAVQQTDDNPCIFGGADCGSYEPEGWPGFVSTPTGGDNFFQGYSLEYTVGDLITLIGYEYFDIGIDTNVTGAKSETLNVFQVFIYTGTFDENSPPDADYEYSATYGSPPPSAGNVGSPLNNGTGFSDYLLTGDDGYAFSIAGLDETYKVKFYLDLSAIADGADSFFFVGRQVPTPGVFALMLLGLAMAVARRRTRLG